MAATVFDENAWVNIEAAVCREGCRAERGRQGMSVWRYLLTPASGAGRRGAAAGVIALLVVSAAALALAPAFMPAGYDWVRHTTSESAAQGLAGAWVARLGFVAFGLAVLWLAAGAARSWGRGVVWMHTAFGVCMVGTAAFSHMPWWEGAAFDPVEDLLHSVTATASGAGGWVCGDRCRVGVLARAGVGAARDESW